MTFEEIKEEERYQVRKESIKEVCINLLKKNMNIKDIIDVTGLSEEEIKKIQKEHENI